MMRRRGVGRGFAACKGAVVVAGLIGSVMAPAVCRAQTLARPGWAGSGIKVTQWWRNSVVVEVAADPATKEGVLAHARLQLGDLQTLGTDLLLLRGVDTGTVRTQGEPQLGQGYGTIDEFDELLREASGRRIRLMVEVPASLGAEALAGDARFWLNRGVSGVYLQGDSGTDEVAGKLRVLRGALRGYAGERVLAGDAPTAGGDGARGRETPDLLIATLRGFGGGAQATDVAALRASMEAARRSTAGVSVAEVDPKAPAVTGEEAKARATALLSVRGSVALRAQDVGVGPEEEARLQEAQREETERRAIETATSPAAASNARRAAAARKAAAATALELPGDATFVWYQRMIGLHRGNAAMLGGEQTLLNEDAEGVLAAVWQGHGGQPLVALVNFRKEPCKLGLTEEFAKLRLRGLFLRTVVRSDPGMGAMPLGNVSLPGYAVYLGQMGR